MGALLGGTIFIEGLFARFMYVSLYRMHLHALHEFAKVQSDTLALMITRRTEPRIKLHQVRKLRAGLLARDQRDVPCC